MQLEAKHYLVLAALCSAVSVQLAGLEHGWKDAMTPAFIGGMLAQIATTVTALFVGPPKSGNGGGGNGATSAGFRPAAMLFATVALAGTVACASVGRVDRAAQQATHEAIVQSEQLHDANVLNDQQFKAVNLALYKVAVAGRELTQLLEKDHATVADVSTFLATVRTTAADLRAAGYPGGIGRVLDKLAELEAQAEKLLGKMGGQ